MIFRYTGQFARKNHSINGAGEDSSVIELLEQENVSLENQF